MKLMDQLRAVNGPNGPNVRTDERVFGQRLVNGAAARRDLAFPSAPHRNIRALPVSILSGQAANLFGVL